MENAIKKSDVSDVKLHPEIYEMCMKVSSGLNYKDASKFDIQNDIDINTFYPRPKYIDLVSNIIQFLNGGMREHCLVMGSRGSGKTGIVNFVLKQIKEMNKQNPEISAFDPIYVNCREAEDSFKLMKIVLGSKKKANKLYVTQKFIEFMSSNKPHEKKILVLDEVDLLKDVDSNLFYTMTRNPKLTNVLMIFISRTHDWWDNLEDDVRSSLKKKDYNFDSYNSRAIEGILKKRADAGLKEYDSNILFLIARANVEDGSGDVRLGIKVLGKWFQYSDYERCDDDGCNVEMLDKIRTMIGSEYDSTKEQIIRSLDDHNLHALYFGLKYEQSNIAFKHLLSETDSDSTMLFFRKCLNHLEYLDLIKLSPLRVKNSTVLAIRSKITEANMAFLQEYVLTKAFLKPSCLKDNKSSF